MELVNAINSGSIDDVKALISAKKFNLNYADYNKTTLLHYASKLNHSNSTKILNFLIKTNKIDINAKNIKGNTPLMEAVIQNCYVNAKFLLKKGADVNQHNLSNKNALHFAVEQDNIKLVKLLIRNHINVNAQTLLKKTPLHFARYDNLKLIKLLIKKGVNINTMDCYINTYLYYVIVNTDRNINYYQTINLLIKYGANIFRTVLMEDLKTDRFSLKLKCFLYFHILKIINAWAWNKRLNYYLHWLPQRMFCLFNTFKM